MKGPKGKDSLGPNRPLRRAVLPNKAPETTARAIAAAMPAGMLYFSILCLPLGLAGDVNTFVAQYYGASRREKIGSVVWQGVMLGSLAIPFFGLLIPAAPSFFRSVNHGPQIAHFETIYFQALAYGAGGAVISAAQAAFFTGLGKSRVVMVVDTAAALLNLLLDYLLIFLGVCFTNFITPPSPGLKKFREFRLKMLL